MTFIFCGRHPHIEERPMAFDLMPHHGSVPLLSYTWVNVEFGVFAFRKAVWPVSCFGWKHLLLTPSGRPSPLPIALLVWYGEQKWEITPLAGSRGWIQDLPHGKPVIQPPSHGSCLMIGWSQWWPEISMVVSSLQCGSFNSELSNPLGPLWLTRIDGEAM